MYAPRRGGAGDVLLSKQPLLFSRLATLGRWRVRMRHGDSRSSRSEFSFFQGRELSYPAVTGRVWIEQHENSKPSD
jgi:hypothetical protein